jgi:hypothetical protein
MKILVAIFLLLSSVVFTQYGNEWIDYSQQYYYFPVVEDGVYRVTKQELKDTGMDVDNIDPRNIQLFARGDEQFVLIEGENDGAFDDGDYLEFYAEHNDGYLDSLLYDDPKHQVNPFFSIYNDTIKYYVTWNNSVNNKRYEVINDANTSGITPITYHKREYLHNYGTETEYHFGPQSSAGTEKVGFGEGEGFVSTKNYKGNGRVESVDLGAISTSEGLTYDFEAVVIGQSNDLNFNPDHNTEITVNGDLIGDLLYDNREMVTFNHTGSMSDLTSFFDISLISDATYPSTIDTWSVAFFKMKYYHQSDFTNDSEFKIYLDDYVGGKAYVELTNYDNQSSISIFYDLTNGKKINIQNAVTPFVLVANSGNEKECFISNESLIKSVSYIKPVGSQGNAASFIDYSSLSHDYLIISHSDFIATAQDYAAYRQSTGYNPIVVDVEELYHQFGEGVFRHPHAIRRFCEYTEEDWLVDPEFLLIVGKGVFDNGSYTISRSTRSNVGNNFVPTYGSPGSDQMFTAGLENNFPGDYKPSMATGRISCVNETQFSDYLTKVIANEGQDPAIWMKNVLHFAGGSSESESQTFVTFLNQMKELIEDTLFGGNVRTFVKYDTNPMTVDVGDSLRQVIEEGVSIMNFMGHASGTNFDYAIDDPNSYANEGKNPLYMGVSCSVGNMYGRYAGSGIETYVNAGERGAIGFIASSTVSIASYGNQLVSNLYEQFSGQSYGEGVGVGMIEAIDAIQSNNDLTKNTALTMNLHGDPAYVVNMFDKPDYTIYSDVSNTSPTVYTIPSVVTTEVDSFDVVIEIANIGRAINTTFWVSVTRSYPGIGLADTTYQVQVGNVFYKDTIMVRMPVDFINGVGINSINVQLDFFEEVDELDNVTNNNLTDFSVVISTGSLIPIYPYEYAVIDDPVTSLVASTGDVFAPNRDFVFQIDTTDEFNSTSHFNEYHVNQSGGVVEWDVYSNPDLMALLPSSIDSIVYFWRVSLDTNETIDGEYSWRESSFQYINSKQGWGQDHFRQFKNNSFDLLKYNYNFYDWQFGDNLKRLLFKTNRYGGSNIWNVGYWVDNLQRHSGVVSPAPWIHVGVLDGKSLDSWSVYDYDFDQWNLPGSGNTVRDGWNTQAFMYTTANYADMFNVFDAAETGDYLFYFTRKGVGMNTWSDAAKDELGAYGVDTTLTNYQIDSLGNPNINLSVIFFGKKGSPELTKTVMGGHYNDFIELDTAVASTWNQGEMISTVIGPSSEWRELYWKADMISGENAIDDSINLEVIGLDLAGEEQVMFDSIVTTAAVIDLNNRINADAYPYMKLRSSFSDTTNNTPLQMDYWHVLYDEIPEVALNPQLGMVIPDSITQEGFDYTFTYSVENISNTDMDSIQVKYWITDRDNNLVVNTFLLFEPLKAGEFFTDTISISTFGLVGGNSIWIEVNPYDGPTAWQAERYHFNNLANWQFEVIPDNENPLLDVSFDGVHILNGDVISPIPKILIKLDDDNEFLALNDTSLFELYVTYPDDISVLPTRIYFSTSENPQNLIFTPASLPDNEATIEFNPIFNQNGDYTLLVRGKDRSANISGSGEDGVYDYRIDFEVINESRVTGVLNYPNPFSTYTQFVFTLTGSEIPDQFSIRIMSINGKVVKEITIEELGNLQIGRNVTEYRWDGTDNFGDRLGNGVYFYKVFIGSNGDSFDQKKSGADQYFNNGFGKLYIMR